jgi:hypothetical protein
MSNKKAIHRATQKRTTKQGWSDVLAETEVQLARAKAKVKSLKIAARIFRARLERNVPFPSTHN